MNNEQKLKKLDEDISLGSFSCVDKPTDNIYIAKNVSIQCDASHINNLQRDIIKFLTGWRYERISND